MLEITFIEVPACEGGKQLIDNERSKTLSG